jgi:hypothetical protein
MKRMLMKSTESNSFCSGLKVALGALNFVLKGYCFFVMGLCSHRQVLLKKDDLYPIQLIKMHAKRGKELRLVLDDSQRMTYQT